jgi:hypothetical protein
MSTKAHILFLRLLIVITFFGCILPVTGKLCFDGYNHGLSLRHDNSPFAGLFCLAAVVGLILIPPAALGIVLMIWWYVSKIWLSAIDQRNVLRSVLGQFWNGRGANKY